MLGFMRFSLLLTALAGWLCGVSATSDNLTDVVTWDNYSLLVNGERVFIKFVQNYQDQRR
jgi:hypothetical protein